jgi:hypothetical protein
VIETHCDISLFGFLIVESPLDSDDDNEDETEGLTRL